MNENRNIDQKGTSYVEAIHYVTGRPVRITIRDGLIHSISDMPDKAFSDISIYVAPGLIDNQINGYAGIDFSKADITAEEINKAAEAIWKDGVTTFLPTVITNSHEHLLLNFKSLSDSFTDENLRGSVPGFHLEGPYLSPEEGFYGTHPSAFVRKPDWNEFIEYQKAARGKIIQVTVAPELMGADLFIEECVRNGIIIALGHTNANAEKIKMAADRGARLSTHLGNGCANQLHRHNNHLWPQLAEDRLVPTIIADGHHLPKEVIQVFYKVKGSGNLILTSDVNYLIGLPPGTYKYLGADVVYTEDGLVKNVARNCLAGASQPLIRGVENIMDYTGCSLDEAIKMASGNVAEIYSLKDRGSLAPGLRADLILFSRMGKTLNIKQTYVKGVLVFSIV